MPDVQIEKPITLDLLETRGPALSATSDMPVLKKPESLPDEQKATKPESKPAPEAKAEDTAAPEEGKTEVEAESAEVLEQPESTSASDAPKKPAKGVQKRLDELTRQREDERRRAVAAEEREARLMALLEEKVRPKAPEATEPQAPNPAEFKDNPDGYVAAQIQFAGEHAAWKVREEIKAESEAQAKKREQESIATEQKKVQEAYAGRVEKFKETHPDYTEVAESPDVSVSIPMAHAIAHSENGPALAYHLGSNPEEATRISKLPVPVQLLELGKLEARLTTSPAKPVSAAPAPIKPTKAATEAAPKLDPETESMDAYAARRKKELAKQQSERLRH